MSNLLQFVGGQRRVTQILGSSGTHSNLVIGDFGCSVKTLIPTSTPHQMQTVFSITGAGAIKVLAMQGSLGTGPTTMRLRLTLDGFVVLDETRALNQFASYVGLGFPNTIYTGGNPSSEIIGIAPDKQPFQVSCLVEASTNFVNPATTSRIFIASETYQ